MSEIISATKRAQLGYEATPGTAATVKTKLNAISLSLAPNPELSSIKPSGSRYPTGSYVKREWGKMSLSGMLDYNEIAYILESAHKKVTASGTGAAKTRAIVPSTAAQDTHATYTVELGDTDKAIRGTYGVITQYKLAFSRTADGSISGSGITKAIEDGITYTASGVSAPKQALILPDHWSIYLEDAYADLLTGDELDRVFSASIESPEMVGNIWPLKRSSNSFDGLIDKSLDNFLFRLTMAYDTVGSALLAAMRAQNGIKYLMVEAKGEEIETGVNYLLRYRAPVSVKGMGELKDSDGIWGCEWQLQAVDDGTNKLTIDLINELATIA